MTQAYLRLGDWRLGFRESCWADWASHLSPTAGGTHITDIYIYSNKWTSILLSQIEEQDESVGAVCKCSVCCYWICVAHYVHKNTYIYIHMVYMCAQSPYAYWRFIFTLMTFLDLGIRSCSSHPSLGLSDLVHCISSQTKIKADELQ